MCGITGFVNSSGEAADRDVLGRMNAAIGTAGRTTTGFILRAERGWRSAGWRSSTWRAGISRCTAPTKRNGSFSTARSTIIRNFAKTWINAATPSTPIPTPKRSSTFTPNTAKIAFNICRGMFAFAIWDETDRSLFLARDRVGKKPVLYSHQSNGDLIFGSEFQAMLEHPSVSRDVDVQAIDSYLSYLCVPAPQTAYKSIRKLEPGHWLKWKAGKIETKRYWLPDFSKKIKISEEEAIVETTRLLRESTKLRMISEVPLGAFLSGGVDSSIVVALMAQESGTPVKTFSIGFEEEDYSELKYARRVAEHVGAEYHEFVVRPHALDILPTLVEHYGEPYADSSAIPTYYVARKLAPTSPWHSTATAATSRSPVTTDIRRCG